MEDKERRFLSFQVSADEAEAIEAAATKEGISRSEYLRNRVLAPLSEAPAARFEALLRHAVYILQRIHTATYAIPERLAADGFLSTETLTAIYQQSLHETLRYMTEFDEQVAKIQAQIVAHPNAQANASPTKTGGSSPGSGCTDPLHQRLFGSGPCRICDVPEN
jgi:hypothetical protein